MIRKRIKADNAVSPVIASLLILVLTIFLIGVSATVIMNVGSTDAAPIAGISISETNGVIFLTHFSGATLPAGEYKILVNGIDKTHKFQPVGQDLAPGIKLTWELGITQPLTHVSVVYTGEGKSVVIAEKTFYRKGTAVANPIFTVSGITEGKNVTKVVKNGLPDISNPTGPLPGVVANKADVWVVVDSISGKATVQFTADEIGDDVTYSWSCPGAPPDDPTAKITTITFSNNPEPYEVTLTVTNGYVSDSSTKKIMIRNPGLTAMTWLKINLGSSTLPIIGRGPNLLPNILEQSQWRFYPATLSINKRELAMDIKTTGKTTITSNEKLENNIWYHAAGTFEENNPTNNLKIYVNGNTPKNATLSGKLAVSGDELRRPHPTTFTVDYWYELTFALTPAEITLVYNAELSSH